MTERETLERVIAKLRETGEASAIMDVEDMLDAAEQRRAIYEAMPNQTADQVPSSPPQSAPAYFCKVCNLLMDRPCIQHAQPEEHTSSPPQSAVTEERLDRALAAYHAYNPELRITKAALRSALEAACLPDTGRADAAIAIVERMRDGYWSPQRAAVAEEILTALREAKP